MSDMILCVLTLLLIGSNVFWGFFCHRLLNKMMSRTYWDYQQAKIIPKEQKIANEILSTKIPTQSHPNELDSLDELIKNIMPLG